MNDMISVASGFQYSVNIAYDLHDDTKLRNFIPTNSALQLLEDILLSTRPNSINRSRLLIGAYGKGKSHIMLMILSILLKRDLALFEKTMPKIRENPKLYQLVENYYESDNKLLPVIITGSSTGLTQSFLLALQRTLNENNLLGIMPKTNFHAAARTINRWRDEFPETYTRFEKEIDVPAESFVEELNAFRIETYEQFEKIYPSLTSGSLFNPFSGFDVTDIYESVVEALRGTGYTGIYVVYDEFSKFLEANIATASVSDTKMLQDFAEKCNRSGNNQLHIMLISHKEIANYIDVLPKQKVDGWRGISDRFTHVHLNNNFTQTYEIIASVIQKKKKKWDAFTQNHSGQFESLINRYVKHPVFKDANEKDKDKIFYGCYPLHPVSTFILPRLSERVAQNERTLFTFLSADGGSTLPAFLKRYDDKQFELITPDMIYDYFEPLFKKEVYSGVLHDYYILTETILDKLEDNSLESKIVKSLSLIYILEQFERIKPTKDEVEGIFSVEYTTEEIGQAIDNLIEKKFVIYLKRSNAYLRLKETSGIDIRQMISNTVQSQRHNISIVKMLNDSNFDNYVYPYRYNDFHEMTRYFSFQFIDEDEITDDINWDLKSEGIDGDGIIYAIVPHNDESVLHIKKQLLAMSANYSRYIFILPKHVQKIEDTVQVFNAVITLKNQALDDKILFDEYEVVYEDLRELISSFINSYTHPEDLKAVYIYKGEEKDITRKASLTGLMSDICDKIYNQTPTINNESINRNDLSGTANTSRRKIITALLRNDLEPNLGFSGTGQEVSIMRSTLLRTGVLVNAESYATINLKPADELITYMLSVISDFILKTRKEKLGLDVLYKKLMSPEYHIGLRKGLIPIYVAAVFHEYKKEIILSDRMGQVPLNSDNLLSMNSAPELYTLFYIDWDPEKEAFVKKLEDVFKDYVIEAEKSVDSYDYVIYAMKRWYMSLPKYSKEIKRPYGDENIDPSYSAFIKLLKTNISGHELLFEKLQEIFGYKQFNRGIADNVQGAKEQYDSLLNELKKVLINDVKKIFCVVSDKDNLKRMSLASVIKDWCETLNKSVFEQLFPE